MLTNQCYQCSLIESEAKWLLSRKPNLKLVYSHCRSEHVPGYFNECCFALFFNNYTRLYNGGDRDIMLHASFKTVFEWSFVRREIEYGSNEYYIHKIKELYREREIK